MRQCFESGVSEDTDTSRGRIGAPWRDFSRTAVHECRQALVGGRGKVQRLSLAAAVTEGTAAAANSRERRREDEAAIRSAVQVDNVPVTAVAAAATRVFKEPALQQIVVECEILGLVGSAP
jgi:hypothetical protein